MPPPHAPLAVAGVVLLSLVAVAAAPAAAADERLGRSAGISDFTAAGNARGDAVAAWIAPEHDALRVAFASRGGPFGRPRTVRRANVLHSPQSLRVSMDASGGAVIAWDANDDSDPDADGIRDEGCCRRALAVVRSRSGRFSRVRTLSPPGESVEVVDADARGGRFGVLWSSFGGSSETRAAVGPSSGRFATRLAFDGADRFAEPLALTVSGRRTVIHALLSGRRSRTVAAPFDGARRRPVRPTSAPLLVSGFGRFDAVARGDLLGALINSRERTVLVSSRVGGRRRSARYEDAPSTALAASGHGVAVSVRPGERSLSIRRRSPDGRLGPPRRAGVAAGTQKVTAVQAAVNARGSSAVAYALGGRRGLDQVAVLAAGRRRVIRRASFTEIGVVLIDGRDRVRVVYRSGLHGNLSAYRGH